MWVYLKSTGVRYYALKVLFTRFGFQFEHELDNNKTPHDHMQLSAFLFPDITIQ